MKSILFVAMSLLFSVANPLATLKSENETSIDVVSNASVTNPQVQTLVDELVGKQVGLFIDDYYAGTYFSNLRNNFGNNSHGTCSYTAVGMLLSFYDSYWDDDFIAEEYDCVSDFTSTTPISQDFEFVPFDADSPGIIYETSETVSGMNIEEYKNFVIENKNIYFQSKLIDLSKNCLGIEKFENSSNPYGMTMSEIKIFTDYYLQDYRQMPVSSVETEVRNNNLNNYVLSKVKQGIPVLITAKSDTLGGHAMIAYDCNENGDIYVHTGWKNSNGNSLTHISLKDIGFTELVGAMTLNVKTAHSHSRNYHSTNDNNICSCMYRFPQNPKIISGNFRDLTPTFKWQSLFREKWFPEHNAYFKFSITDASCVNIFKVDRVLTKSYTLTKSQWDMALYKSTVDMYCVYLELGSDVDPYLDEYYSIKTFKKPKEYTNIPFIRPIDYAGFEDAYPTDDYTKNTFVAQKASNSNFTFKTRRYRTGYIHNEYIVMSPKRKGIKEAYIEYKFEIGITRIDVALSHWRSTAAEGLTSSTGTAVVQQFWGNQYTTKLDLLSTSTNLSQNRNSQTIYAITFEQPVYWIRFYTSTFDDNTNDSNRGRICIGDMAFYIDENSMPLSGSELDYEPDLWNSDSENITNKTNCYSYALNAIRNPNVNMQTMQPGQSGGINSIIDQDDLSDISKLLKLIENDAKIYGFVFERIGKYEKCQTGTYKVALVVDPDDKFGNFSNDKDYHWYRQNSDGTWSHKPGRNAVVNVDYSNHIITDPETCNRKMDKYYNYTEFVGFFAVKPLNTVY